MFPTIKAPIKSLLLTNKTSYCCSKISSTNSLLTTIRSKHSNRQIKRLFKQNPAFQRVSARNDTQPKKLITPPPPVTIDAIYQPNVVLSNGWSNPPLDEEIIRKRNEIPFAIKRTGGKPNGSVGFLPVYSNFRYVLTVIFYDIIIMPILSMILSSSFIILFLMIF